MGSSINMWGRNESQVRTWGTLVAFQKQYIPGVWLLLHLQATLSKLVLARPGAVIG